MNDLPPVPSDSLPNRAWAAYIRCLAKDNYARLSGRSSRFEYWSATIIGSVLCLLPIPFLFILPNILIIIALLLWLGLIIYLAMPLLAVFVRRLHDVGWSGWWIAVYYTLISVTYAVFVFHVEQAYMFTSDSLDVIIKQALFDILTILYLPMELLSIFLFVLTLIPGKQQKNKYGDPVQ